MKRRRENSISFFVLVGLMASLAIGLAAPQSHAAGPWAPPSPLLATSTFNCDSVSQIARVECEALVALYNSTDGAHWYRNSGWLSTATPCTDWVGIICMFPGHVSHLMLANNGLRGSLAPEVGNLAGLFQIAMQSNGLTGSIPPELGRATRLVMIDLSNNQLTGNIPRELGQLTGLTMLRLSQNQLSGSIPAELGNMTSLAVLDLGGNRLSGSIPPALADIPNLTNLRLAENQLTGGIPPQLGKLALLEQLQLDFNPLGGSIPPELGRLANLKSLILSYDELSGQIPPELADLRSLENLSLWTNQLTGTIPPQLGKLTALRSLSLSANHLTGSIPPDLGNLSSLDSLGLAENQLTGSIPPQLGNLSLLGWLGLSANRLTGPVPPDLGRLRSLWSLDIQQNPLAGPLPRSFLSLSLTTLMFEQTNLCAPADAAFTRWLATIQALGTSYRCHTVSGMVADRTGQPMPGVSISAGPGYSAQTDNNGAYAVGDLVKSTYTFTPTLPGYKFAPPIRQVEVTGDLTGVDFLIEPGPLAVTLIGASKGMLSESHTFYAAAAPLTTTLPITYTWEASGQAPVVHVGGLADQATFNWVDPGVKTISVTAASADQTARAEASFGVYAYQYRAPIFPRGLLP